MIKTFSILQQQLAKQMQAFGGGGRNSSSCSQDRLEQTNPGLFLSSLQDGEVDHGVFIHMRKSAVFGYVFHSAHGAQIKKCDGQVGQDKTDRTDDTRQPLRC